jgi:polyphosphate kinase 2 (PPK2 family)
MFASALIGHKLAKEEYQRAEPELRTKLLEAQLELVEARFLAVVIVITGMDGAGKSEVIHKLLEWLDPRHVQVAAYAAPDDTERTRPPFWRYWRDLPSRGQISVVFGSWYSDPLLDRLVGTIGKGRFERELAAINRFEEMLTNENVLLLKFLLVVSAKEQQRRLAAFAKRTGGASRALEEWADVKSRRQSGPIVEELVRRTSTGQAPWVVIPCDDPEYRDVTFGRSVLGALAARLQAPPPTSALTAPATIPTIDRRNALDTLDLSLRLEQASTANGWKARSWNSSSSRSGRRFAAGPSWSPSRGTTPPARAAPFAGSPWPSIRGSTGSIRWRHQPTRRRVDPISGDSGAMFRA